MWGEMRSGRVDTCVGGIEVGDVEETGDIVAMVGAVGGEGSNIERGEVVEGEGGVDALWLNSGTEVLSKCGSQTGM
jgi:hypothetical protein